MTKEAAAFVLSHQMLLRLEQYLSKWEFYEDGKMRQLPIHKDLIKLRESNQDLYNQTLRGGIDGR